MVTINAKQFSITEGTAIPICHTHSLKSEKHFGGGVKSCYITEMSDGRYAVFTAGYQHGEFYKVFEDQETVHNEFEEIDSI